MFPGTVAMPALMAGRGPVTAWSSIIVANTFDAAIPIPAGTSVGDMMVFLESANHSSGSGTFTWGDWPSGFSVIGGTVGGTGTMAGAYAAIATQAIIDGSDLQRLDNNASWNVNRYLIVLKPNGYITGYTASRTSVGPTDSNPGAITLTAPGGSPWFQTSTCGACFGQPSMGGTFAGVSTEWSRLGTRQIGYYHYGSSSPTSYTSDQNDAGDNNLNLVTWGYVY